MAEDALGSIWSGLAWLGGIAFHLLKRYCGRWVKFLRGCCAVCSLAPRSLCLNGR